MNPIATFKQRPEPQVTDARLRSVTPESLPAVDAEHNGYSYRHINIHDWLEAVYGAALLESEAAPSFDNTTRAMTRWLAIHPHAAYRAVNKRQDPTPARYDTARWEHRSQRYVVIERL